VGPEAIYKPIRSCLKFYMKKTYIFLLTKHFPILETLVWTLSEFPGYFYIGQNIYIFFLFAISYVIINTVFIFILGLSGQIISVREWLYWIGLDMYINRY
jgi:hypothetical protein